MWLAVHYMRRELAPSRYSGTLPERKRTPPGPYSRPMHRVLRCSVGVGVSVEVHNLCGWRVPIVSSFVKTATIKTRGSAGRLHCPRISSVAYLVMQNGHLGYGGRRCGFNTKHQSSEGGPELVRGG